MKKLTSIFIFFLCSAARFSTPLPEGALLHLIINMESGTKLLLTDDSIWEVAPEDREISRLWLSPFPLKITRGESDLYPYLITNMQSGKKVKARPYFEIND